NSGRGENHPPTPSSERRGNSRPPAPQFWGEPSLAALGSQFSCCRAPQRGMVGCGGNVGVGETPSASKQNCSLFGSIPDANEASSAPPCSRKVSSLCFRAPSTVMQS